MAEKDEAAVSAKTDNANTPVGYRQKFASIIAMCRKAKRGDVVSIATPHTLGDSYDEIIESLNRLSNTEAMLLIVPRAFRRRVEQEVTAKHERRRR